MQIAALDWLPQLPVSGIADVRLATLVLLLAIAAAIDVRTMRIPNWLTLSGAGIGLALSWIGEAHPGSALLLAAGGMLAGLALMLPFWLLRVMGAGDVKLMAMVGAFVGLQQVVPTVLSVFVAGGLVAVSFALYRRMFRRVAANVGDIVQQMAFGVLAGVGFPAQTRPAVSAGRVPYGVSICAGTIAWATVRQLGYL